MITALNYLAIFSIFTDALSFFYSRWPVSEIRIPCIILFLLLIFTLPYLKKIYFSKSFFLALSILSFFSIFNILLGNNNIVLFLKQIIGISINALMFYTLFIINNKDIKKIFSVYMNIAFFIALIGLIQVFANILKIRYLYDFSYFLPIWKLSSRDNISFVRVNSILPEPSAFCFVMLPAFFAAIASFWRGNFRFVSLRKATVIILAFLFSFSAIGHIGVLFSFGFIIYYGLKLRRKLIFFIAAMIFLIALVYNTIPEFHLRIYESISIMTGKLRVESANQSTFSLLSNALVAKEVIKNNSFFGNGLGSYKISFWKYIDKVLDLSNTTKSLTNDQDANSLILRLSAETGLFGLSLFLYFIFVCFIPKGKDNTSYLWIINNGIFILFILRGVRYGHYFNEGFFLFFWMYYFTKKISAEPYIK